MIFYMDLGTGWQDISDFVRDNYTITERACSEDYKYAVNTLDFTLTYNEALFETLHSTLGYVYVRVMEDDDITPAFIGRFVPTVGITYNGVLDIQMLSLSVEDYTSMLDILMDEFVTENMYIMNSTDATHSIVHVLFTHLGLSHSLIDPSVSILDTVGAAVADEDSNALDFISTLMYEYGWIPNWSVAGLFAPIKWIQDDGALPTTTFNDLDIMGELEESPRDLNEEASKVYWYGLGSREDTRVYTESLDYDDDGDFEGYPILRETYYPDEANVIDETTGTYQVVEQEYSEVGIRYGVSKYIEAGYSQDFALEHADFTRVLITKNHIISDKYDDGLTRDITIFDNKKAQIRYWNPNITSRQIYYMHIDADTVYTKSKCTCLVEYVAGTRKIAEYDSSFLFTAAAADKLAKAIAMALRLGRYTYKIQSADKVAEGTYVSVIASNGIIATGLVLERVTDGLTGLFSYVIRSYDTNYMPVVARTVKMSSLSSNDAIAIATSTDKSPVFTIEGVKEFGYYVGEIVPINTSLVLTATPSDVDYVASSYQWYYRTPAGVDTALVGETNSTLTMNYDDAWFYSGVPIICEINGKYSFQTKVNISYGASFLGEFSADPSYSVIGDWYFYTGATGGGKTQFTMYLWNGTAWIEDAYPSHNAKVYDLISSASSITLYSGGGFVPNGVVLTSKVKTGQAGYFDYDGRFTVEESTVDATYSGVYASPSDEHTYTYVPSGVISTMRFRLYEAGAFDDLIEEIILPVNTSASSIESMAPRYWGALTSAPISDTVHINDYYWDNNVSGAGGGTLRYFTGESWQVMTATHDFYQTALKVAMTDMMIWASVNSATITAVNAVFESIAAASAFITELTSQTAFITELTTQVTFVQELFAQYIEVPDGGRLRFYNGQGIQKRAVELSKDHIDWIDTPDTSPASDELLQGRIGRLGVGGTIQLDGDFKTNITMPWGAESVINAAGSSNSRSVELANNNIICTYIRVSDAYVVQRTSDDNGATWAAEVIVSNANSSYPTIEQLANGLLIVAYRRAADNYLVQRISSDNGATWAAEVVINNASSYYPSIVQLAESVLCAYVRGSDDYLVQRTSDDNGATWGAEVVINNANSGFSSLAILANGSLIIAYTRTDAGGYLVQRTSDDNGATWEAEVVINNASSNYPSIDKLTNYSLTCFYRRTSDGYIIQRTSNNNGATWTAEVVINNASSGYPSSLQPSDGSLIVVYTNSPSNYLVMHPATIRATRGGDC